MSRWRTVILVAGSLIFAALAWRAAAVAALGDRYPDFVTWLAPRDPAMLEATTAANLARSRGIPVPRILSERARSILRGAPLNAAATRYLAAVSPDQADALLGLSERVSRRDISTQLTQIERSVARGDIAGALRHYDIALTVYPQSEKTLLPVLVGALGDPAIDTALIPYVQAGRSWIYSLILLASQQNRGSLAAAVVIRAGGVPAVIRVTSWEASVLYYLMQEGALTVARDYYLASNKFPPSILSDVRFTRETVDSGMPPFSWALTRNDTIDVQPHAVGGVRVTVEPDSQGLALSRLLFLSPGNYRLVNRLSGEEGSARGTLQWRLSCMVQSTKTSHITSAAIQEAGPNHARVSFDFSVEPDCLAQQLNGVVSAGESQIETTMLIDDMKLERLP